MIGNIKYKAIKTVKIMYKNTYSSNFTVECDEISNIKSLNSYDNNKFNNMEYALNCNI